MRVNRRVGIWKHVRLVDGKWRYCRPVPDARGKIVADGMTHAELARCYGMGALNVDGGTIPGTGAKRASLGAGSPFQSTPKRIKHGLAWSRSTLLHQRGSALADFLELHFKATKLLRA